MANKPRQKRLSNNCASRPRIPTDGDLYHEFDSIYEKVDIRTGIKAHAKETARELFIRGFNYGVQCERSRH